ncbi:hypothetical protein F5B22DRAFT_230529 [Xylaria bambusicola]|uniref:uncharacterized protein n=1 Tax=Xylaria bambusicola TaxID=326684 RepID=UPI0020087A6E|nr:uncharacterized protein F5B22DRAFT_230529 [Xylaria bambusicola]KAI0514500.1 hypothetical protein F5B22DRAFT_230529 [Xylaria bambusicola]
MTKMPVDTPPLVEKTMANISSTARNSRALSISSDRPSTVGVQSLMSPPLSVSPEAAFIAASAASQIVTNDHDNHSGTWYDQVGIDPAEGTALVANGALLLANNFVDQLLFNVLATAKSTTLASLRSAVIDVLKPKLAKDVINSADEELREYLGGGEIEDLARPNASEVSRDWDLELVWKRTRLRCMVYSSLGDMEEEDEDYYVQQEHLGGGVGGAVNEVVSPAVAIFLTSILEFMGEQVLIVAGQASFNRLRANYEKEVKDGARQPGDVFDRIVVEELDMERVALDRTLGRLWRAWKKRIRSPMEPNFSRPFSRSSANGFGASHQRRESTATEPPVVPPSEESNTATGDQPSQPVAIHDNTHELDEASTTCDGSNPFDPSTLPLPDSDIEATYSDEEESEYEELPSRPKSWFVIPQEHDLGSQFASKSSIKRTPSLPSRKKPRYETFNTTSESLKERTPTAQASDLPEAKPEAEVTAQITTVPSKLVDTEAESATAEGIAQPDIKEDEFDGDIEEFVEEPEILTSSRVSVGGRSSPTNSESGRPASIILTRSSSVRSVRVIEVQGPRSRASSIESNSRSPTPRSVSFSREEIVSKTPPIVEEKDPYAIPYVTVTKNTSSTVSSYAEDVHDVVSTLSPPPRSRLPPRTTSTAAFSHTSAPTIVSIVTNASLPQEERYEAFQRPTNGLRNPPMPTLPERSANRPVYSPTTSTHRTAPESPRLPRSIQNDMPSPARFRPKRTSEESSSNRPADVARDFEELIQSNETLQYTLTPENMRDIDSQPSQSSISPSASQRTRRSDDGKFAERSRSSSIKRSLSVNKASGLSSHPSPDMTNGRYSNGTSKALTPVSMRSHTAPVPQARDARVPRESLQDFADFIRSTGPPVTNATRTEGPLSNGSANVRSITRSPSVTNSSNMEARRGPKLQARDATVNTTNESSDLIDFIRRGPPSTNSHRIPRTVAPFRNTQDSDYMSSAVGGKAVDAIIPNVRTSLASTNITEASAPSSMNSQSALLNKSNRHQLYNGNSFDDDEPMPKRTQRRVLDPYAIDISDEEEFDIYPKAQPKQEESLIDFLNNYAPPAEPQTQFLPPKKKSSAPNLIARLRSGSSTGSNGSAHFRKGSGVSDNRTLNSRTGSKVTHTPIVIPPVVDRYASSIKTIDPPRNGSVGRVPMKKFEPRDASSASAQTTDLANFFRDSRPPPSIPTFTPPPEDKASSGFSRMFERRKKPTAY